MHNTEHNTHTCVCPCHACVCLQRYLSSLGGLTKKFVELIQTAEVAIDLNSVAACLGTPVVEQFVVRVQNVFRRHCKRCNLSSRLCTILAAFVIRCFMSSWLCQAALLRSVQGCRQNVQRFLVFECHLGLAEIDLARFQIVQCVVPDLANTV